MDLQLERKIESDAVTYDEALEKAGNGKFQYMIVAVGGLVLFSSYVSPAAIAYVLPAAQCDLKMDSEAKGRLTSVGFIGLIISCHLWGFLSDTLGRRYILIRCLLADGSLYIVTSLTPYYHAILVLRLLNGFVASGGVACIYAYVGEFINDKKRTNYLMISVLIPTFAYFAMPVCAWLTISANWTYEVYPGLTFKSWRFFYAVCGIPSLVCSFVLYFLPESPKFLVAKGETKRSIAILTKIHEWNKKSKDYVFDVKNIKINENEKVAKLGEDGNKVLAFIKLMWDQTAPLFQKPHRRNIALVCLAQYVSYYSNGGLYLWLPELMNRLAIFKETTDNEASSFCEVMQYSKNPSGINNTITNRKLSSAATVTTTQDPCSEDVDVSVYGYLVLLGLIELIVIAAVTVLLKICSKKYILIALPISCLVSGISLQLFHVTDFIAYNACIFTGLTYGAIPVINTGIVELFPTNLRGMASCLTLMICRIGTLSANIIAGMLIDNDCNIFICSIIAAEIICLIAVCIIPNKSHEKK